MHFMKAIAIFITRIFTRRMIDGLVLIAPFFQPRVNIVLVRVQRAARLNQPNHHVTRALQQTQDWWFLVRQGTAPTFPFQAAPPTLTAQFRDNFRVPFVPGHDVGFSGFNFTAQAGGPF